MNKDMIDFCMEFGKVKVDGTRPKDELQIEEEKLGQVPDAQQNSPRAMFNSKEAASPESDIKEEPLFIKKMASRKDTPNPCFQS